MPDETSGPEGHRQGGGVPKGGKWKRAATDRYAHGSFIYSIKLCPFESAGEVCAVVGGSEISLVQMRHEGSGSMKTLGRCVMRAKGPDGRQDESLYACEWILLSDESLYVMVAGLTGTIYLVQAEDCKCKRVLQGHGNAVNALKTNPLHDDLLLSASADESIRLWNVATGLPLAVFSGERGHASEILSLAWSLAHPNLFASAGMDFAVKIWSVQEALDAVPTAGASNDIVSHIHEPLFSSCDIHNNYVDDVAWLGGLLLSKSVSDEIVLWRPVADVPRAARLGAPVAPPSAITVLQRFRIHSISLWYVRMGVDAALTTLACGNTTGKVYVWRLRWDAVEAAAPGARPRLAVSPDVVDCGVGAVPIRCVEVVGTNALAVGTDDGRIMLLVQRRSAGGGGA